MMKKALFIISLKYPLFNAINIKMNELKEKKADIILDGNKDDYVELATRLESVGVFENVFLANPDGVDGIKLFLKHNSKKSFIESLLGSIENLYISYLKKNSREKFIQHSLQNGSFIDFNEYDEIFVCSESSVSLACTDILIKDKDIRTINLIEEGVRDYYTDYAMQLYRTRYKDVHINIYLYEPNYIGYSVNISEIKFCNIPKLSIYDNNLKHIMNIVFGYKHDFNYDHMIIFFEQVAEPMPPYLKNTAGIKKIILHNAYKKHMKEHRFFLTKRKVIDFIIEILNKNDIKDRFAIKLHPRTKKGILPEWKKYIVGDDSNRNTVPWEVYCLNNKFNNNSWVTIDSSSILNRVLCFKEKENIRYILLYNCLDDCNKKPKELINFYKKIIINNDNIFMPNNYSDLELLLTNQ